MIRVPVLLYHSVCARSQTTGDRWQVTAADFAADMEAVAESGRTPITASAYASWLYGDQPRPERPILITFDDGFADYADVALPILERYNLVATLFVTTGRLGWPGMLSAQAVLDLSKTSTEIGAHSVSHRHLDILRGAQVRHEITACRDVLEDLTGAQVNSFAYPHGSQTAGTRAMVASSGYLTAHAVKNAISHPMDDPFAVARFTVHSRRTRQRVRDVINGHGAPLAWRGERPVTNAFRLVRKVVSEAYSWS